MPLGQVTPGRPGPQSAQHAVVPIPDALPSAEVAPLLCAGTTVFNAIVEHGVRRTDHVAVVGVGGLGHIALQGLAAWGCHVTAIFTSTDKAEDAQRFGAGSFLAADQVPQARERFDFILGTVGADLPWDDSPVAPTRLRPCRGSCCRERSS